MGTRPVALRMWRRQARNKKVRSSAVADGLTVGRRKGSGGEGKKEADWPPLALCVLQNMRAFPGCILLTRVGGFYEVCGGVLLALLTAEAYFEQAPLLATAIGIKLAARRWVGSSVPMAGFPIHQLDKYLKVLVKDKGFLVAISEEFKKDKVASNDNAFERRVTRVVSPGTLIDERFLDPFSNNFILSIARCGDEYGLAWLDVSTADFTTTTCPDDRALRDEVARIHPREVVLVHDAFDAPPAASDVMERPRHLLWEAIDTVRPTVSRVAAGGAEEAGDDALAQGDSPGERAAIAMLTAYLRTRLLEHMPDMHVDGRSVPRPDEAMHLDAHALAALEVRETEREGSARGSLASVVRRTVTHGGTRLLQQWLTLPSTSISLIRARHALVELFLGRPYLRGDVRSLMRAGVGDILRTLQRISLRRSDEQDLLEVRDFIRAADELVQRLHDELAHIPRDALGCSELRDWLGKTQSLRPLGERLGNAIDERVIEKRMERQEAMLQSLDGAALGTSAEEAMAAPAPSRRRQARTEEGETAGASPLWGDDFEHLIRPDASPTLRAHTDAYNALRREARALENDLRAQYGEGISLKFLLGQGHVVHLPVTRRSSGSQTAEDSADMKLVYKTKTTRTFYHSEWTRIGMMMQKLETRMTERESQMLEQLREDVLDGTATLRRNARLIDQLDVLVGFAQAAEELTFVRPTVDDSHLLEVRGGRHLGVEMGLLEQQRLFVRNDVMLGDPTRMRLITGPNMGGKSTYLRQNAIIAILAQAGSFVPADAARVGIVDRVFSRVGAKDDLFQNRSTFMVEMMETAEILRRATPRSLVIADEIGRGTNTTVGLAIAFAALYTLAVRNRCRTLFATHYYELADMLEGGEAPDATVLNGAVGFSCTTLERTAHGMHYSHRVRPGVNRASHGLEVARLADMPDDTMDLATRTYSWLEKSGVARVTAKGALQELLGGPGGALGGGHESNDGGSGLPGSLDPIVE